MEGKLTALLRGLRSDIDAIDWTPVALARLMRELDKESKYLGSDRADALPQLTDPCDGRGGPTRDQQRLP